MHQCLIFVLSGIEFDEGTTRGLRTVTDFFRNGDKVTEAVVLCDCRAKAVLGAHRTCILNRSWAQFTNLTHFSLILSGSPFTGLRRGIDSPDMGYPSGLTYVHCANHDAWKKSRLTVRVPETPLYFPPMALSTLQYVAIEMARPLQLEPGPLLFDIDDTCYTFMFAWDETELKKMAGLPMFTISFFYCKEEEVIFFLRQLFWARVLSGKREASVFYLYLDSPLEVHMTRCVLSGVMALICGQQHRGGYQSLHAGLCACHHTLRHQIDQCEKLIILASMFNLRICLHSK